MKVFELETSQAGYEVHQFNRLMYQVYGFDKAVQPYKGCWLGEFTMLEQDALTGFRIPRNAINAGNAFIVSVHNTLSSIGV